MDLHLRCVMLGLKINRITQLIERLKRIERTNRNRAIRQSVRAQIISLENWINGVSLGILAHNGSH